MKKLLPSVLFLLLDFFAAAQTSRSQIEVMPYVRYDAYPGFSYNFAERYHSNYLEMKGRSWGTTINYKYLLGRNFWAKAGLGYYRFTFDELNGVGPWGPTVGRPIGYPSPMYIIFVTDKYWYNCVSLNVGLEKAIPLGKNFQIVTGINFSSNYTYSQYYHITYNHPEIEIDNDWKQKEKRHFSYSGTFQLGLTKTIQKYAFGPSLLLPFYDKWRKDSVFGETNDERETRDKKYKGWGLGISISRNL